MVTGKNTEQFSIYLSKNTAKQLKHLAEHYRWNASQTVVELMRFYTRMMDFKGDLVSAPMVGGTGEDEILQVERDESGNVLDITYADTDEVLSGLLNELGKGLLGAFRDPMMKGE